MTEKGPPTNVININYCNYFTILYNIPTLIAVVNHIHNINPDKKYKFIFDLHPEQRRVKRTDANFCVFKIGQIMHILSIN